MILRRCQPSESRATAAWIAERHYTGSKPPGFVCVLEFLEGSELIGAMLLGKPSSRAYEAGTYGPMLELNRVYFVESAPRNTESQALAMMRKFVRVWYPDVRLLVSYSDPGQGHTGAIYKADGWAPFGETGKKGGLGWQTREGRREDPVTSKQRWVRTP